MRTTFGPRALADVNEIGAYIANDNASAAALVVGRIRQTVAYLGEYPLAGRPTNRMGLRCAPVPGQPYLVFYRIIVRRNEVRILRVRHAARRPLFLNEPSAGFAHEGHRPD